MPHPGMFPTGVLLPHRRCSRCLISQGPCFRPPRRATFWGAMRHCLTIRQPDYVPLLVATPSIDAAACEADRRYTHPDVAPAGAGTIGGRSDPVQPRPSAEPRAMSFQTDLCAIATSELLVPAHALSVVAFRPAMLFSTLPRTRPEMRAAFPLAPSCRRFQRACAGDRVSHARATRDRAAPAAFSS